MVDTASPVVEIFANSASILDFGEGNELSASEVADRATRIAAGLADLPLDGGPLAAGDRVALWMPNGLNYIESFLACAHAGYLAISVNTKYGIAEVEALLTRSGARVVITDQDWEGEGIHVVSAADLSALAARPSVPGVGTATDRCVMFTTSGTTSQPKMVVHRQSSIADHALDLVSAELYTPDDVALVPMPLCGTFGLSSLLMAVAADCSRVLVPPRFEVEEIADLVTRHRVSVVNGSDDMFHRLLGTTADLSSIRLGGYARFNTSLDGIVERADARGMTLVGLYGMSEVQALFTIRDSSSDAEERSRAGGRISALGSHARVVDGELQLRGPSLFEGYLAEGGDGIDTELTTSALTDTALTDTGEGEWFLTGDSAEMVADGREFTFLGRLGDVLRIGGFLVAPSEIEQVLMSYPGVEAAQVVALDRPSGARPVAFVVLANGSDDTGSLDEEAMKQHCLAELAKFKVPIRFFPLSEFPMLDGPNGKKVRRTELRDIAQSLIES